MISLAAVRGSAMRIVAIGNHHSIIQSILDFDYIAHKKSPSVYAIITRGRSAQKFFFGTKEIVIPCFSSAQAIPKSINADWMLNMQSGRRTLVTTKAFFEAFPHAVGGVLFAENVPEYHQTELIAVYGDKKLLLGPASVGFIVPGALKLGAIGGVEIAQMADAKLSTAGSIGVISTSGGMTNELIRSVIAANRRVSFAAATGGERFPITSASQIFSMAEQDPHTKAVVYFGELGGTDEYEIAELMRKKKFTKKLIAYIAGTADDQLGSGMQFGHAKALALSPRESAGSKRQALLSAGAEVTETYREFISAFKKLPSAPIHDSVHTSTTLMKRQKSILSTRTIADTEKVPQFVVRGKLARANTTFTEKVLWALLGKKVKSPITLAFAEAVFSLLIDHGGHVSGAVNTMITARAGKDMSASLATGILTIGPRFGGALNAAAKIFVSGLELGKSAAEFVNDMNVEGTLMPGIGHKKYRVGLADPRVTALSAFVSLLKVHRYYDFAREIEKITTRRNGSLILNIDGVIAAVFLDILSECEKLSPKELETLIHAEFFNALFIIPRSVGFIAHFMEQKTHDEGLFRLPEELLYTSDPESSQ